MNAKKCSILILILVTAVTITYTTVWTQGDVSEIVEQVSPAVVKVLAEEATGSGFIISPDGYIITNYHVVSEATKIQVKLRNDKEYEAAPIAYDGGNDLALIKIQATNLPTVELGNSDNIKVGSSVLALGYPFGSFSVTTGILSAIRDEQGRKSFQMSSPVNKGNSGGSLLDESGKVIGIVFAKADLQYLFQYGTIPEGIGFSIPINVAKRRFQITKEGYPQVKRPPEKGVLFEDDFSNPASGWPFKDTDISKWEYKDGEYSGIVKKENYISRIFIPSPKMPRNFCVELEVRASGHIEGAYGIFFGYQDSDNYYLFLVTPYGAFFWDRIVNGKLPGGIDWEESNAINKGERSNKLRLIIHVGNKLKLYVNDKFLKSSTEYYYKGGKLGLFVWAWEDNFEAKFDNVKLMSPDECW